MPSFLSKFVLPFSVVVALFAVVAFPTIKNDTRVQTYVSENFGFDITGNPITFAIDTLKSGFTPPPPSVHTNNRGDSSDSDSSDYTSNPSSFFSAEMMSPAAAASARTFNAAFNPSYGPPVALFVGGTSGIGQGTAEAFARHTKGNAHIFIIGRNRAAAESIIASFPKPTTPGVTHEFVQCDLTLMKNVHKVTQELLIRHPKINFLVMSPGFMTMNGRNETEEGIDTKLAVHYYSRWKLIDDLLPALRSARDAGEDAKVLSVLAAGKGGAIDVEDLGLKKAFTVVKAGLQAPTYNDLMMESFAALNPGIAFTHSYPGFVRTNLMASSNSLMVKLSAPLIMGLAYPFSLSQAESGEFQLSALLRNTAGVWRTGEKGQDIAKASYHGTVEQRDLLWEHTKEAVKVKA